MQLKHWVTLLYPLMLSTAYAAEDPYLWLEQVQGDKALAWVEQENKRSLAVLESDPRFKPLLEDALDDLTRSDRLPAVTIIGEHVYDLLQDENHARGLWRRMTTTDYIAGKKGWETVLDVDALAKADGESWVFRGASCVEPTKDRCMITLSPGGSDAAVYREFDLVKKAWVTGGFELPEMKTNLTWLDRDSLLVSAADKPENITTSGYGRVAKRWRRGTDFSAASPVMEVPSEHMGLSPMLVKDGETAHVLLADQVTIFQPKIHLLGDNGKPIDLGLPPEFVMAGIFRGQAVGRLLADWQQGNRRYRQGSLISFNLEQLKKLSLPPARLMFEPNDRQSVNMLLYFGLYATKHRLYFTMMEDVKGRLVSLDYVDKKWTARQVDFPDNGVIRVVAAGGEHLIVTYEDMLTPPTQFAVHSDGSTRSIDSLDPRMDTSQLLVEQHFATSKDGTKVPYFIARPKSWSPNNPVPTLMAAYGGFGLSSEPGYLGGFWGGHHSKVMLQNGGAFVLANIRGGAEYGPNWHQQGILQNRQRVYDDFHAIAEDLISRGYTSAGKLGIYGASNSGLLMGVSFTQRPDLYKAVLCGVPLLDMQRYHVLLAGASWMGEYGNPEDPAMWEVIQTYSPYHNLHKDRDYPEVFFFTSTKDDRVHPAHARKMAARMKEQGHPFLYFENMEGGHGAAADLTQKARLGALHGVYLLQQLGMTGPSL